MDRRNDETWYKKIKFKNRMNLDIRLMYCDRIYTIDSIESESLRYGISDGKFAVFWPEGAVMCELADIPRLAERIGTLYQSIKEEVLAIYEDIKDIDLRDWRTDL